MSYIMPLMALHELHPFHAAEVAKLPQTPGVYVLFQVENPIHAGGAANLRKGVRGAKARFPRATHFSVEALSKPRRALARRMQALKKELSAVRVKTFVGLAR
jgi:excinuclease UvrABC nuclease subunit